MRTSLLMAHQQLLEDLEVLCGHHPAQVLPQDANHSPVCLRAGGQGAAPAAHAALALQEGGGQGGVRP